MPQLSAFQVLTFDCYGTLIDWETGICRALGPWLEAQGVRVARDELLAAFAAAEAPQQQATPDLRYPELLARVHRGGGRALWRLPRTPQRRRRSAARSAIGRPFRTPPLRSRI